MDETLHELVSRYLDDDLDPCEKARFEESARIDAALAAEIEHAQRLQIAVAALARKMEPPAALDRVVKPLLQSAPLPPPRVRPVYRWLGAAAAVVLGVSVAVEVAQRNPEPTLNRPSLTRDPGAVDKREIFQLSPLPTAVPNETRPLGATDRLLEEEPVEPEAAEPLPMDVLGPLPVTPSSTAADEAPPRSLDNKAGSDEALKATTVDSIEAARETNPLGALPGTDTVARPAAPKKEGFRAGESKVARTRPSETDREAGNEDAGRSQASASMVVMKIGGTEVWNGRSSSCAEGVSRVLLEIRGGLVTAIEAPAGEAPTSDKPPCWPEELLGTALRGLADGSYSAEIVVRND